MKKRQRKIIKFEDPTLLRLLCGSQNEHFAILESTLDLLIEAPGGEVQLSGSEQNISIAIPILQSLYDQLKAGYSLKKTDIRVLLRNALSTEQSAEAAAFFQEERIPLKGSQKIMGRTPVQRKYIQALKKHELVFGIGPAGTGKTFLAVSYGVSELQAGRVSKLVIARPAVEAGEKLGFLPGDLVDKVQPYMQPIWDALYTVMGKESVERHREKGNIEVAPLAFMRGRTLSDAYIVIDEAQNATQLQMRMILTRLGEKARMVITGDSTQIDLPDPKQSGLEHAATLLEVETDIATVRFTTLDVVRHPLVARILKAYEMDMQRSLSSRSARTFVTSSQRNFETKPEKVRKAEK